MQLNSCKKCILYSVVTLKCGETSSANNTYISGSQSNGGLCNYKVCKCNENVCRIRLDFNVCKRNELS